MSKQIVLNLVVRLGEGMQSSNDVAKALEQVADRIRVNGYVETINRDLFLNPYAMILRGIVNVGGASVGEFSLVDSELL